MQFKISIIKTSVSIRVEGLVQGVGFRPFIYRLAKKYDLAGNVTNRTDGVIINLHGEQHVIEKFKSDVAKLAPPASFIKDIFFSYSNAEYNDFVILPSESNNEITEISPDIAVCNNCLDDLKSQQHRLNYPFVNCTNCGPRFSIVSKIPYDRINTSMSEFTMCEKCSEEYHNVLDRRFHAQPVACNQCGPKYFTDNESDFSVILKKAVFHIDQGSIIAIKGLGGYNIICDANNNKSVSNVREIKGREGKPFAVMLKDLNAVDKYCYINQNEKEILQSWQRPIVLLKQKKTLAASINNELDSLGVLLPYLPVHYLLFESLKTDAIVYTSANISGSPIVYDDELANYELNNKVDLLVSHNRKIENPLDDSVIQVVSNKEQLIRRSRSFVPKPIYLNKKVEGIFACGAELKNVFAIGKYNTAILSQHIGDLKNLETYHFYNETVSKYFNLFKFEPQLIACDMHPEYLSSRFTEELNAYIINGSKIPIVKVQHHHAHIASCLAENHVKETVIGVSFDGTGYGTDGNIWGGEFLVCDTKSFDRFAHFKYVKTPGGDTVVSDPRRMLLSYLNDIEFTDYKALKCFDHVSDADINLVNSMINKGINSPLTSSAGRLFDAVSCLLNLCTKQTFDAEAPMRLESSVKKAENGFYSYNYNNGIISFDTTIYSIIEDLKKDEVSTIAAKFHNTITQVIIDMVKRIKKETGIQKVVLSGGTFQNKYLLEKTIHFLTQNKFEVYTNHLVPPNDGGIALGQLIVASNFI